MSDIVVLKFPDGSGEFKTTGNEYIYMYGYLSL